MSTVMTIGKRVDPRMKFDKKAPTRMTSFTVYALMCDLNDLGNATYRDNREFYYVSLAPKYQNIIEMMVVDISGQQFELVTRKLKPDRVNFIDTVSEITPETYLAMKSMSDIGFKHTYLQFAIPGTVDVWEVSVFIDNDGHDHPWVRLELFTDRTETISELPFTVSQFIVEGDPQNTPQSVEHIRQLWLKHYSRIDTTDVIKS